MRYPNVPFHQPEHLWTYPARMIRMKDADTQNYELLLRHHDQNKVKAEVILRSLGVNGPDTRGGFTKEQVMRANEDVRNWCMEAEAKYVDDWPFLVQVIEKDNFGREVGYVWRKDTGECLSDFLIAKGHSNPILVTLQVAAVRRGVDINSINPQTPI
jgi:endonuclease YncB( thermonuclease family)